MKQGDVQLIQTTDDGEITVVEGDLLLTGGLETAVYVSLFGGNLNCSGRPTCPFTWWANHDETDKAYKYVSETQYLIGTVPMISANLRRIEEAAKRDLCWLRDNKIASDVTVNAYVEGADKLKIVVDITAVGIEKTFEYVENWKNNNFEG